MPLLSRLNNISLQWKNYASFGVIIALILCTAAVALFNRVNTVSQFNSTRELSTSFDEVSHIAELTQRQHTNIWNYLATGETRLATEALNIGEEILAAPVTNPQLAADMQPLLDQTATLDANFDQLVEAETELSRLIVTDISSTGPQLTEVFILLAGNARNSEGGDLVEEVAMEAYEYASLVRLYIADYLRDNDQAAAFEADAFMEEISGVIDFLREEAINPAWHAFLDDAESSNQHLQEVFAQTVELTETRNALLQEQVAPQMETISVAITEQIDAIEAEQGAVITHTGEAISFSSTIVVAIAMIAIVVAGVVAFGVSWLVIKPIVDMSQALKKLAEGEEDVAIPHGNRGDEIGEVSHAATVFQENARKVEEMQAQQVEATKQASKDRHVARLQLADQFEASVMQVVQSVAESSSELENAARAFARAAIDNVSQGERVGEAATTANSNVQAAATAADQLADSIREIAEQVGQAATVANQASERANAATNTVNELTGAADRIGEIVSLITDIANRTNLLALNATIESARAGEAGRGFAVVASEVKSLAQQTAQATEEIASQVASMQSVTGTTAETIAAIARTIDEVNQISTAISAAVEEQSASVSEISGSTALAASETENVTQAMGQVRNAAEENKTSAEQSANRAHELGQHADKLHGEVENFLKTIRAG